MVKTILNRVFFGKKNAFKYILNDEKECYFHVGKNQDDDWTWKKAKMNDVELAKINLFLKEKQNKVSFYHEFEGDKTQIWLTRDDDYIFIKIEDYNKRLSRGEQEILQTLIEHSIVRMNMDL